MNKKLTKRIIGGLLTVLFAVALFFSGFFVAKKVYMSKDLESIKFILDVYKEYYYQEEDNLPYIFADSLMDEYSRYYTKEEYELTQKASSGYRKAIGISVDNNLIVTKVLYNSPAEKEGLTEGAKITHVNGVSINTRADFEDQTQADEFTFTTLYLGEQKSFTICKQEFTETFVRYYDSEKEYGFEGEEISLKQKATTLQQELDEDTGYLIYRGFSAINSNAEESWKDDITTSAGQFASALNIYKQTGKTKLIIDLRNNGGGYMTVLSSVLSHFMNDDKALIAEAKYKNDETESFYSHTAGRKDYTFESITVLVNENTASASEAFVGALLDYDDEGVVKVICEYNSARANYSSFGKGIMQSTVVNKLSDEAVKLTVAEIFWPVSKKSIHGKGISSAVDNRVFSAQDNGQPIDALKYALSN